MIMRSVLVIGLLIAAAVLAAVVFGGSLWMHRGDSPSMERNERTELLGEMRSQYELEKDDVVFEDRLPKPVDIKVNNDRASVIVANSMYRGNFIYAQDWYRIYNQHHGHNCVVGGTFGCQTVVFRVHWSDVEFDQEFPVSDL